MYFPDVYMNFNARAPILHFQLIAKQQKVQLHVFEHNSTHTGEFEVSNEAKGLGKGREICTYDFTIFVASIHGLRHGQNGRDGSYLHHGLATCGLDMH